MFLCYKKHMPSYRSWKRPRKPKSQKRSKISKKPSHFRRFRGYNEPFNVSIQDDNLMISVDVGRVIRVSTDPWKYSELSTDDMKALVIKPEIERPGWGKSPRIPHYSFRFWSVTIAIPVTSTPTNRRGYEPESRYYIAALKDSP